MKDKCSGCDKILYLHKALDNKMYCLSCFEEILALREMKKKNKRG